MGRVTIDTCELCECPLSHRDGRNASEVTYKRRDGLVIEAGFSRGGWGHRDIGSGIKIKFSGEVCHECFAKAQALLEPVRQFIQGGRGWQEHHDATVRSDELAPQGRKEPILRSLRALLPRLATGDTNVR